MGGLSDRLKHVVAGRDRPSAEQQNIIVDILQSSSHRRGSGQRPFDTVGVTNGWIAFRPLQISDIDSISPGCIAYSTKTFDAPNTDKFEMLICEGVEGLASFGYHPILASIAGSSFPSIGEMCGPKHGETSLYANYPGFRFLGESDLTGIGWVIRDRGNATGQGTIITSSGQSGVPTHFELENVTFSAGFNGWDHSSDLSVHNTFGDTAEAGLIVQFKWDVASEEYVSTDVSCAS